MGPKRKKGKIMKVGFTGTQQGMTDRQRTAVRNELERLAPSEFHHGDCIGSDAEAHWIANDLGIEIHVHPPTINAKRAFCGHEPVAAVMYLAKPYLNRNIDIVDMTDVLVATPRGPEELRSGTWMTIRYARRQGKEVLIFEP